MRRNVGTDARLIECVHVGITTIEHAVQFEDVAVSIRTTKFIAGSLYISARRTGTSVNGTHIKAEHEGLPPSGGKR